MKYIKIISIILFFLFSFNLEGQIKKISTQEISDHLDKYGLDSTMSSIEYLPILEIFDIDTILTRNFLNKIDNENSKYSHFLLEILNNHFDSTLSNRAYQICSKYCENIRNAAIENEYTSIQELKAEYLYVLIRQHHNLTEKLLIDEYKFWHNAIEKIEQFSFFYMFFKKLKGDNILEYCHLNCLNLQLALKEIKSIYHSDSLENFHQKNIWEWMHTNTLKSNVNIYENREAPGSIYKLENDYNNLKEINFYNEPNLAFLIKDYTDSKYCTIVLVYNHNIGILDLSYLYSPTAGYFEGYFSRYKIELINRRQLKLVFIDGGRT
ncbi:MAG: hypothetical protein ABSG15_14970 [FCB group bacterium]|jgi:hypothetical protein